MKQILQSLKTGSTEVAEIPVLLSGVASFSSAPGSRWFQLVPSTCWLSSARLI